MPATQIHRPFRVKTPLGDDALLLESFEGHDRISTPYRYVLKVLSENADIDMAGLLQKPAVLTLNLDESNERHIHGSINRFKLLEFSDDGLAAYEMEIVPWIWYLNLFSNCRIFQNKTVPDIIKAVFGDRGFTQYKDDLHGSYEPREYCVQYRETDFNFVSRLMEDEGIFYFFEQTAEKHTLVLADQNSTFANCPHQPVARFLPSSGGALEEEIVHTIASEVRLETATASLRDYDFEKPRTDLYASLAATGTGEDYDFPGKYKTKAEGDRYARIRLEEKEVRLVTLHGSGNCMGFECGGKFKLTDHYRDSLNAEYTIVALNQRGVNTSYRAGDPDPFDYNNTFEAIPASVPFRPPRVSRKPFVRGSQTAVVVGKAGEEIWVDQYGRIKVQFFWDRQGTADENSSCWMRVGQFWAGKQWGAIFTPRIGQEVIVTFLEGDPDRPLITGSLYNGDQMPPYTLPDEMTKSTIKSLSTKDGGGFNEFRFEDKKGSEQLFIHAQKDMDIRVENDRKEWIGEDRHLIVKRDKLESVERDAHDTIKRDLLQKVGRDHHLTIEGKESIAITGNQSVSVTGNVAETYSQNHSESTTMNISVDAMQVVIEGKTGISLVVGGSYITITPAAIQIFAPMVMINSGGSALSGSPGNSISPTAPTDPLEADQAKPGDMVTPHATGFTELHTKVDDIRAAKQGPPRRNVVEPSHNPSSPESKQKKDWIEINLVDEMGKPVPGERYRIKLPDGSVDEGTLDDKGHARVDGIDPGSCEITFPDREKDAWDQK